MTTRAPAPPPAYPIPAESAAERMQRRRDELAEDYRAGLDSPPPSYRDEGRGE